MVNVLKKINGGITSHVFLTLEHDECVSAVWLLLLIGLLVSMGISDDTNLQIVSIIISVALR